jgi:catechol 2,3-dioxygenase-like lactoylglutathione lyase family enzyme
MSLESKEVIKVKKIAHIGIVVRNLEETTQHYWEVLGIGPWEVCEAKAPLLHNQRYNGDLSDFTFRLAFAKVGSVSLELAEPVSGNSDYDDFLASHGEGVHHIGFEADDTAEITRIMSTKGFSPFMSGGFGDGEFVYYDTKEDLKCVWEAVQMPKAMPPMTRFPEQESDSR